MGYPDTAGLRPESNDVVALLMKQHEEIRTLLDEVLEHTGEERRHTFRHLVHLLAVHETAEEEVVHPYARRAAEGGEHVVADRLKEEDEAKRALKRLESLDPDGPAFVEEFTSLRESVRAHARAEETYEFTRLLDAGDPARLQALAKAVRAAEAVAPTRPHPGTDSAAKNALFGPPAAVADRARDAMRKVLGRS
ncbi:hemerythrin domain-containing protein [Streptomyces telluris]|uniref:Hemerythrin domain-containing protein n=1 Tax=Streptomyces telluris TaxID=2720021 RepID=A0A9X2RQ60_9ACTN|nr:hemerythrin domain-containing protein [Streptomyces telluris]MCQ8771945.1 hemerythrin domain-containing protein [Streptomyces telluris]NJP78384.1 hemerythrin domain-containing protein [Streptomyces telluris]